MTRKIRKILTIMMILIWWSVSACYYRAAEFSRECRDEQEWGKVYTRAYTPDYIRRRILWNWRWSSFMSFYGPIGFPLSIWEANGWPQMMFHRDECVVNGIAVEREGAKWN